MLMRIMLNNFNAKKLKFQFFFTKDLRELKNEEEVHVVYFVRSLSI